MVKQSITINGKTLSWDVPFKVKKKKKKKRQKRKKTNRFKTVYNDNTIVKTNFVKSVEDCHTKDFTAFLKEHPWFSLDSPSIIDEDEDDEKWFKIQYKEDNKEWFKKQYKKDLKNMIKAVGHIEM